MQIFLFSTQPEIFQFLAYRLEKQKHIVHMFKRPTDVYSAVKNSKILPDLLIMDYKITNHTMENIYDMIYDAKIYLPAIFYNDPCIGEGARAIFWRQVTETGCDRNFIPKEKFFVPTIEELNEVFLMVEAFVESKEFSPYIYLMQEPKPFPKRYTMDFMNNEFDCEETHYNSIYKFKDEAKLPKNLFYLLQIFFDNIDTELELYKLTGIYSANKKRVSEQSMKVMISQLRKYIKSYSMYNFYIQTTEKGYIFFIKG